MAGSGSDRSRRPEREPRLDYHDPTAGIDGAPPAASALTLRVWLAGMALVACVAGAIATVVVGGPVAFVVVLGVVAVTAVADLLVIWRRRRDDAAS
jgi:hypothetical protein